MQATKTADTEKKKDISTAEGKKSKFRVKSKGVQGKPTRSSASKAKEKPTNNFTKSLEIVLERNEHYRSSFKNLLRVVVVQCIMIVALISAFLFYMHISRPQDFYFAITRDGRELPLIPLSQPNMQRAALLSWAAQAASEVMTFGFHDYEERLGRAARHFTPKGFADFREAMIKSRMIEGVVDAQQIITAVPKAAPVLKGEGLYNGKYRWVVDVTLLITYQSGDAKSSTTMNVTLYIVRVSTLESPNGVGIDQWIAM